MKTKRVASPVAISFTKSWVKPEPKGSVLIISPWRIYSTEEHRGERIRKALEEAGTIFIKFGQLLSTRPDLIPADIAQSLHTLQDSITAFPTDYAKEIIEAELGSSIEELFTDFDPSPIAAASIAQVYSENLKDSKEKVAIKVVRPGIDKAIDRDISLMKKIAQKATGGRVGYEDGTPDPEINELDMLTNWWKKEFGNISQ